MGSKNRNQGVRLAPWMFLTCWAVSLAQDHSFSSASLSILSVQNLPWRTLSSYLEKLVTCNGHVRVLLKRTPMESGVKTPQSPATEISLAEARNTREPRPFRCHTMWNVHIGKRYHFPTVNGTYPTCQNNREPSDPPLANSPSWTGCQATAAKPNKRKRTWLQSETAAGKGHQMRSTSQAHTCGFLLVTSEDLKLFFQVSDIKKLTEMVTRCCEEPVAIEV